MGPTNSRKVGWIKMAPIIRDPITLILTLSLFFCPQLIPLVVAVLSPLVEEDLFPEYYRQEVPPSPSARNRQRRYKTKPTYIHH